MNKEELIQNINKKLDEKIDLISEEIKSLRESRNNDTKSSAGDKYETGREMIQIELNKLESLLDNTKLLKTELQKINTMKKNVSVDFGSLVFTNQENYFISIAFGKLNIGNTDWYVISKESPIALALKGKKKSDTITFQNRNILIKEVE